MKARRFVILLTLLAALGLSSGCAQLLGSLRRDLDDGDASSAPATVGGRWAEGGFLAQDYPEGGSAGDRYVGHAERNPASASYDRPRAGSWITPERDEANQRDSQRGMADEEEAAMPNSDTHRVMDPGVRRQYKNGSRATRADFLDESPNEGSLWASDGQTNYYFTKNKIRGVGDIITVTAEADLIRDIGLEARRTLSPREREFELAAAQERLRLKAMGAYGDEKKDGVATAAAAPNRFPAAAGDAAAKAGQVPAEVEVPAATYADVDVSKSLEIKQGDTLMGEIIERYPNGNYKIRATKKIPYKGGASRMVNLVGVVKGSDIAEDDTLSSGKLYEYRIEATR